MTDIRIGHRSFFVIDFDAGGGLVEVIARLHQQLFFGIWSLIFLKSIENIVYISCGQEYGIKYLTTKNIFIFIVYSVFLFCTSALFPYIVNICTTVKFNHDTRSDKNKVIKNVNIVATKLICLSKIGYFCSILLFNLSMVSLYSAIENMFAMANGGNIPSPLVAVFISIFVASIIFGSFLTNLLNKKTN